jgi:hypothetical protein
MPLFFAAPFLVSGCIAFLVCAVIPQLRRFTLASSLWCISFGACILTALIFVVLATNGAAVATSLFHFHLNERFNPGFKATITLDCISVIAAITGATAITMAHGWILRRVTLNLFRLYLVGVTIGVGLLIAIIGSTLASVTIQSLQHVSIYWAIAPLFVIPVCLILFIYPRAREFRDARPLFMNPITPEEFG